MQIQRLHLITLCACFFLPGSLLAQEAGDTASKPPDARPLDSWPSQSPVAALCYGVSAWERSITTIETKERLYQPVGVKSLGWSLAMESSRGFECDSHWYIEIHSKGGDSSDKAKAILLTRFGRTAALNQSGKRGVVREVEYAALQAFKSTISLMGKHVDLPTSRSIEQILRDSSEISYLAPSEDQPWPGIRVRLPEPQAGKPVLTLRVDPTNAFVPRVLDVWDDRTDLPRETVRITRVTQLDGVYFPSAGVFTTFGIRPLKEDGEPEDAIYKKAMGRIRAAAVPETWDAATVAAVKQTIDSLPIRTKKNTKICAYPVVDPSAGFLAPMVIEAQAIGVNKGLTGETAQLERNAERKLFDFFRRREVTLKEWATSSVEDEAAPVKEPQ